MSSNTISDFSKIPTTSTTKNKKSKKKKGANKNRMNGEPLKPNGIKVEADEGQDNDANEEPDPDTPIRSTQNDEDVKTVREAEGKGLQVNGASSASDDPHASENEGGKPQVNGGLALATDPAVAGLAEELTEGEDIAESTSQSRGTSIAGQADSITTTEAQDAPPVDGDPRIDTLAREKQALQDEVAELRKSLEDLHGKHEEELVDLRGQLEQTQGEKEHADTQYRTLLGRVNTIKSQLGERLKADAEELSQARSRIDELEGQCDSLREQTEARTAELSTIAEEGEQRSKELSSLRNRTTLSQQNWTREREDLVQKEAFAREEFEAAKQAMQDWEVLAMEERSIRENLAEKVADLEEQVTGHREAHEKAASERDSQALTVDGLQRALQEIQDARRRELREIVENSQTQAEELRSQLKDVEKRAAEATTDVESTKQELERALPFEKEVKEKNLLIGKLRHEAVILNDHLTKALRYLKKGKPEENIDKQLISNHFLHFLALERADPKKFQILQIIAALLAWSDDQREQAGLARPGASNPNLRVPLSPWHRTPSTPALSTDFFPESSGRKESLAELWSGFLEQQAQEGVKSSATPDAPGGSKPP